MTRSVDIDEELAEFRQIPEVDQALWQWGAWVCRTDMLGIYGSVLGRLHKQRMKELKVWDQEVGDIKNEPGPDDSMLAMDQAIARLDKRLIKIIKWRYWHRVTMMTIAQRMHRSLPTVNRYLVKAHKQLQQEL